MPSPEELSLSLSISLSLSHPLSFQISPDEILNLATYVPVIRQGRQARRSLSLQTFCARSSQTLSGLQEFVFGQP